MLDAPLIARLDRLFTAKPELLIRLEGATGRGGAIDELVRIGAENGLQVDPAEIRAQIDRRRAEHPLSDTELNHIAAGGGATPPWWLGRW